MGGIHTDEELKQAKLEGSKRIDNLAELNTQAIEYLKWFHDELIAHPDDVDNIMNIVSTHWGDNVFLADVEVLLIIFTQSIQTMPKKPSTKTLLAQTVYLGEFMHQYLKYKQEQDN